MKRKTLITSILVIVLCLALISGSTYSLFTSESSVNMVVTSGKVDVSADVTDLKVYSATADTITTDLAGEIQTGPFAGTYYYQGPLANSTFANGGTAAWATDTKVLTIDKITPGDKVTLNVDVQNNSNVAIQYRVRVNVLSGLKLYEGLVVKTDNISLSGIQKVSNWTYLPYDANTTALATIPVEIYLPLEAGNTYQDLSTSLRITVEAVQGNANVTNETLTQPITAVASVDLVNQTSTTITDDDGLVEATVPHAALVNNSVDSLSLKVKPTDSEYNIAIESATQAVMAYDVKVLITNSDTGAIKENNTEVINVRLFVGKDLTGVKLYHNGVEMAANAFSYDSTTGYISFNTNSFSEYSVVYNKDIAVETVDHTIKVYTPTEDATVYKDEEGNTVTITINDTTNEPVIDTDSGVAYVVKTSGPVFYDTLQEAIDAAESGCTVGLLKSVTITTAPKESLPKYAVVIEKSLTLNGNGNTITTGIDRVIEINGESTIDVTLNDVTLKCSANSAAQGIWAGDYLDHLTLNNVIIDNRSANSGYVQAMTIAYDAETTHAKRNITIKNSKVLNAENIGYAIIFWAPVDLTVVDSEISGWSALYFKPSSNGSNTTITGGKLTSVGIAGYSNSFGLISFENSSSTVTITNTDINVSTSATDSVQSLVSFSEWYGPNTGNTVTINGGKITLTGDNARYYYEKGTENKLTINGAIVNSGETPVDYSYVSPSLSDIVAYMYMAYDSNNQLVKNCDGYYNLNELITASNNYPSYYFCNGEWFEFYSESVVLTDDVVFNMNGGSGTFGFVIGNSSFTAEANEKITIPAGVTIKTDKAIDSMFAAPNGYQVVKTELTSDATYSFAYTVEVVPS